ncbi:hypothetical protein KAK06_08450 [Ideonella sp. 4Y11]|uniref:Uncharacterized protein n=1 Tax=Ideonella aquatica TaxID=2824119 RepID=A0A940YN57_9BURK|nr:hypothetical protein [Ideonella aquatica]MBQ0958988.1 hypothetical protein [Ideonella aquatica]
MKRILSIAASLLTASACACGPGQTNDCAYVPVASHDTRTADYELPDPARAGHPVPFRLRYPVGATAPIPVVIWNHGGGATFWRNPRGPSPRISDGQLGSPERSKSFARAGYAVIHIGRMPLEQLDAAAVRQCRQAGWAPPSGRLTRQERQTCMHKLGQTVHAPANIAFVVEALRQGRIALPADMGQPLDLTRIVVGGWSAGTQPTMNLAGAYQRFGDLVIPPTAVPGVIGFMADAPRRPTWACAFDEDGDSGFQEDSFDGIDARPFLFNTAMGDYNGQDRCPSQARIAAFLQAAPGRKLLAWSDRPEIDHATVDLDSSLCADGDAVRASVCAGLLSTGQAWMDAVLGGVPAAWTWLGGPNARIMSDNHLELHRREARTTPDPGSAYVPLNHHTRLRTQDFDWTDSARHDHPVPLRLRWPVVRGSAPLPVVIWHHGGGTTSWRDPGAPVGSRVSRGQTSSAEHGEALARLGFAVVHIGRMPWTTLTADDLQTCAQAGMVLPDACREFLGWKVHGPLNAQFVAAELQRLAATLPVALDWSRVVVGGWSGGSEVTLKMAGAQQRYNGVVIEPVGLPNVKAYLLSSPRGPAWAGFNSGFVDTLEANPADQHHSFNGIADGAGVLWLTGRDDRGGDLDAFLVSRPTSFFSAARGAKLIAWSAQRSADGGPVHGTYDLGQCGQLKAVYCAWFENLQAAFLDAVVFGRPQAQAWLASDAFGRLSGEATNLMGR